jgi:hypothetical protein
MVYRGKPSKACSQCRRRRLLCDFNRNGCAQCRRASLVCGGYKDTTALRIHDETLKVQARSAADLPLKVPRMIELPICQRARDVFYYNYVIGKSQPLQFLQPYYDQCPRGASNLLHSIDAVSLAYFNFQRRTISAHREAQQHYISALRLTRFALEDSTEVKQDSTILSVILLDMYEKITNNEILQVEAWATHINAALVLAYLRGDEQFHRTAGIRILERLSINAGINCTVGGKPLPLQLMDLRRTLAMHIPDPNNPKWRQNQLMPEYAELQQKMKDGTTSDLDIIKATRNLESRLVALLNNVDPPWRQQIVQVQQRSRHHFEAYHSAYETEESARIWNVARLHRILLNEMIWSRSQAMSDGEQDLSRQIINSMAREICSTVPQFILGIAQPLNVMTSTLDGTSLDSVQKLKVEPNVAQQLACYRLIYPLYIAAQSSLVSHDIREWILGELRFMADFHAIQNAANVIKALENGGMRNHSRVYHMLGSYAFVC